MRSKMIPATSMLAQLLYPGSTQGAIDEYQALATLKMQVPQFARITNDCIHSINNTENVETFFTRLDLLYEKLEWLCAAENFLPFQAPPPSEQRKKIDENALEIICGFIDRAEAKQQHIDPPKTKAALLKKFKDFLDKNDGKLSSLCKNIAHGWYNMLVDKYQLKHEDSSIELVEWGMSSVQNLELSKDEITFFEALIHEAKKGGLKGRFELSRYADRAIAVRFNGIYVGRIRLFGDPSLDKYAVVKQGSTRATRVFDTYADAENFIESKAGYQIETRHTPNTTFMQYNSYDSGHDESKVHGLENPSLEECIATIPKWIEYINECLNISYD